MVLPAMRTLGTAKLKSKQLTVISTRHGTPEVRRRTVCHACQTGRTACAGLAACAVVWRRLTIRAT